MAEEQDRISYLPDDILIRILSLLPTKEIARTSLLSKAWRKLSPFSSLSVLMFQSPDFFHSRRKSFDVSSFINAIDSSLRLRQKDVNLVRLRLRLHLDDIKSLIDSWIDAALERKVKELDLYLQPRFVAEPYDLPAKIFSATTITVLSLEQCRLEICGDIDLPALRKLCLRQIQCDEQAIRQLISSCPLIEDLNIASCGGLQKLHVSGLANLHRLQVICCYNLRRIEIDAPSLQHLVYHCGRLPCDMVLTPCEFLRELILLDPLITNDFLQNLDSGFPNLERLEIDSTRLQRIEISHHQLKRLELRLTEWQREAKLKIDAPNLQSFTYSGYRMPLTSTISSMNTSSLREAEIHFRNYNDYSHFFIPQLKKFFEKSKNCQVINLLIKSKEVLYNKFRNKEENPKCCTSCPTKCWRHYLEDVQIDGDESILEIDQIIAMPKLSQKSTNRNVRFRLKWRSQLL
ncbi:putative F-box/LRR-repeat protein [Vitis vinifera]|uniref:Putative F-box/LRR-repeat protein n=1 Tax=Vitis vinifera TaxID=29760 RepID=A0A438EW70_VITVI|nr:putative F-box/LRR-repeat protein [Vitis vinifera]